MTLNVNPDEEESNVIGSLPNEARASLLCSVYLNVCYKMEFKSVILSQKQFVFHEQKVRLLFDFCLQNQYDTLYQVLEGRSRVNCCCESSIQ